MRTVNSDALALLARIKAGERIPVVQLVELRFDTVLYLTTAGRELVWGRSHLVACGPRPD